MNGLTDKLVTASSRWLDAIEDHTLAQFNRIQRLQGLPAWGWNDVESAENNPEIYESDQDVQNLLSSLDYYREIALNLIRLGV